MKLTDAKLSKSLWQSASPFLSFWQAPTPSKLDCVLQSINAITSLSNIQGIQMEIARTILSQINVLDKMAMCAWGAKDLVGMEDGLMFKSSGLVRNKGKVIIKLNGNDLYDVTFGKVLKFEYKELVRVEDVFVENLVETVDNMVG